MEESRCEGSKTSSCDVRGSGERKEKLEEDYLRHTVPKGSAGKRVRGGSVVKVGGKARKDA